MFPWLTLICAFSVTCGNLRTPTDTYGSIFVFFPSSQIKPNQGPDLFSTQSLNFEPGTWNSPGRYLFCLNHFCTLLLRAGQVQIGPDFLAQDSRLVQIPTPRSGPILTNLDQ